VAHRRGKTATGTYRWTPNEFHDGPGQSAARRARRARGRSRRSGRTLVRVLDTPARTESELNATTPDPTVATAPSEFTMTVAVRSHSLEDGTEQANWSAGVMYDADDRERVGWLHSTGQGEPLSITHYRNYTANRTHNFVEYHNADREEFARRVGTIRADFDEETETLRVDNGSRTYRHYRKRERSEFEVVPDVLPSLGFIQAIPFEYDGTTTWNGRAVERYRPVNGWTKVTASADDSPDTYVSNTSGALYVSRETGNIVRANVSTTSKRTDVRAGRWFGDGGSRNHFTLTVREDADDALRPDWTREAPFEG